MKVGRPVLVGVVLGQMWGKLQEWGYRFGNVVTGVFVVWGWCMGALDNVSVNSFQGWPEWPLTWCSSMMCCVVRIW